MSMIEVWQVTCPRCDGEGNESGSLLQEAISLVVWDVKSNCKLCKGTGVVKREREVEK